MGVASNQGVLLWPLLRSFTDSIATMPHPQAGSCWLAKSRWRDTSSRTCCRHGVSAHCLAPLCTARGSQSEAHVTANCTNSA
jgi:hypothetical protein